MKIKFSEKIISSKCLKDINDIIKSGWLTHGKYTTLFEEKFRKFTNSKYSLTVSSCTAGLHLSCLAAGFSKGDEVIVPAMTHTATSHAIEYTGAKAIFCDVDSKTGNLTIENLKKKISKKTKGIIIVHMNGKPCDLDGIKNFCNKKKIKIIEDCAHALGTRYKKKHVGNFGLSGSFSFYPTKQITTGEGGMIITNNKTFFNNIKKLKAFGIDKEIGERKKPGEYDVKLLGYNYRMTDFQSCLGLSQLKYYKKFLSKRQKIAKRYHQNFNGNQQIQQLDFSKENSYFIYPILIKNRDKLVKFLKRVNIGFSIHYPKIIPQMSYYKNKYKLKKKSYKNAIDYAKKNISLPVYPTLNNKQVDYISKKILNFISNEK
tara:strand:+ start:10646 stop:11764 length:1119 start_codon:yes stop_codon:yes gene_type:complete